MKRKSLLNVIKLPEEGEHKVRPYKETSVLFEFTGDNTTGRILQIFKSVITYKYTFGVKENGWKQFAGKLWQKNYYDHIIKNEKELVKTREYILNNTLKWNLDEENSNIDIKTRNNLI
jgi:hypothetical protein